MWGSRGRRAIRCIRRRPMTPPARCGTIFMTTHAIEGTTSAIDDGSFHTRRTVTSATAIATFSDDSMLQHDSYGHHMLTAQCEAVYCLRKIEMSACPNQHPV